MLNTYPPGDVIWQWSMEDVDPQAVNDVITTIDPGFSLEQESTTSLDLDTESVEDKNCDCSGGSGGPGFLSEVVITVNAVDPGFSFEQESTIPALDLDSA